MRQGVYSIFDKKALDHQGVTLSPNDDVAVRWLREGLRGSNTQMEKFPEDFQLRCVGVFDTETGQMTGLQEGSRVVIEVLNLFRESSQSE